MAEAIPLCATLCVQCVAVVIGDIFGEGLDRMLERLTAKGGFLRYIERKAIRSVSRASLDSVPGWRNILQSNHLTRLNLRCRGFDTLWRQ